MGNGDVTVWDCLGRESVWVAVTSRCGTPWEGSPWEPVFALMKRVTLLLPFVYAAVFFISSSTGDWMTFEMRCGLTAVFFILHY